MTAPRKLLAAALLLAAVSACAEAGAEAEPDTNAAPISALAPLEPPAAVGTAEPNLYATPDGRVILSWLEPVDATDSAAAAAASTRRGEFALRVAVLEDGRWGEAHTVARGANFFVNWADFPSVIALPDGSLAAHWLVRSGEGTYAYDVHVARSTDDGATWTNELVPHSDGTQTEHGFVSLFAAGGDRLGAVWLDGRKYAGVEDAHHGPPGAEMTLRYATIGTGGEVADEAELDGRTCDCCQTAVAVTSEGPLVVYRDRSEHEIRDISVVRLVDGEWTEPRAVHDDGWEIPACPVNGPAAAASGRRVAVAWFTAARDTGRVYVAFSEDAGASFGDPVRVDDGDPSGRVDVVLLDDGGALVTWLERSGDGAEVRVRRAWASGQSGPAAIVAASTGERASGFPHLARAGDRVYFAWTEPGKPGRVRAAAATVGADR